VSTSLPPGDGRALGQVLLGAGFVVLSLGLALCGYSVVAGGFEAGQRYGGGSSLDTGLMVVGVVGLAAGVVLLATGALFANAVRRPHDHRTYGQYLDVDDDDDRW